MKCLFKIILVALVLMLAMQQMHAQNGFKKLLPDHLKFQYAGGFGFISIGAGYSSKNQKLEGDLLYGYLPKSIGGVQIHSLSGKFNWIPFHLTTKKKLKIEPLITGFIVNYNFGGQYFAFDPPNYSYKYYSFPTAINTAIFIGSRISLPQLKRFSFYYEILGFDRDIISFVDNLHSMQVFDILTLALGVRIDVK